MKKKITFLPYDLDTAAGITNEGTLAFSYNLEDIDQTEGGADVYNGQRSVLWKNVRAAFGPELAAMYQRLRSTGALSFEKTEQMFTEHQKAWGEAVFNEDSYEKYLVPLIAEGNAAYLAMLQGSKASQRKWWLYNRFRYLDSKYNAGDALADFIQLRGYAKSDITVTPYADVYPSVKYGSYLVQERGERNKETTLPCPLDNVNDTEIIIFSASQLASVGDLSGLKVGFADFSMGTKLQSIKVGDQDEDYTNGNLKELHLGTNPLLREVDVRNCPALGTGDQKSVDLSGCPNIERVYFDGTAITGVDLPNGGVLKEISLPATVTNLTVRNHPLLNTLEIPSLESVTTLWLENVGIDEKELLRGIPAGARVRLSSIRWEVADAEEISALYDLLDQMRGLDEYGGNMDHAQINGVIHLPSITGADRAELTSRYPFVRIDADHTLSYLTYKTWDGGEVLKVIPCADGVPQDTAPEGPSRADTERFRYSFVGWSLSTDASSGSLGFDEGVLSDRVVYAAYSRIPLTYLRYTSQDGSVPLKTVTCAAGVPLTNAPTAPIKPSTAQYDYAFVGWSLSVNAETATEGAEANVTEDRSVYAAYAKTVRTYSVTWKNSDGTVLETDTDVPYSTTPRYDGPTPQNPDGGTSFQGWMPPVVPVVGDVIYTASYTSLYTVKFWNDSALLQTVEGVPDGGSATYTGETPTHASGRVFEGWNPPPLNIHADTNCYAQFKEAMTVPTSRSADSAYGVEWDYSQTSPNLTRKGLAVGMSDPEPATSLVASGSSPFDEIAPWKDMKRYCDIDGEWVPDTDSRYDERQYDTMVYIPTFYYTAYKDEENSRWLWAVSPTPLAGYVRHPGSGRFVSRFHTGGNTSAVFSKSNVTPLASVSQTNFRSLSKAKGDGWGMWDLATLSAIQMLFLVEFASFDAQKKIGEGLVGFNSPQRMGTTGTAVYHTVKRSGQSNTYRWIEDLFANVYDWIDGFVGGTRENYAAALDSYEGGTTGLRELGFSLPGTGNFISGFGYSTNAPWAFIPDAAVGSVESYVGDKVYANTNNYPAFVGCYYNSSSTCGLWFFDAAYTASTQSGNLGSRLMKRAN